MPLNHSCKEIPSQTFVESPKSTRDLRIDTQPWDDKFHEFSYNTEANKRVREEDQRVTIQTPQEAKVNNMAIVQHSATGEILSNVEGSQQGITPREQVGGVKQTYIEKQRWMTAKLLAKGICHSVNH